MYQVRNNQKVVNTYSKSYGWVKADSKHATAYKSLRGAESRVKYLVERGLQFKADLVIVEV